MSVKKWSKYKWRFGSIWKTNRNTDHNVPSPFMWACTSCVAEQEGTLLSVRAYEKRQGLLNHQKHENPVF